MVLLNQFYSTMSNSVKYYTRKDQRFTGIMSHIRHIGILTGSPSDKFETVKLSSKVPLTSSGQIITKTYKRPCYES